VIYYAPSVGHCIQEQKRNHSFLRLDNNSEG
jgi:hypothetical protein